MRNAEVPIRAATVRERCAQLGAALPHGRGSDKGYGSDGCHFRRADIRTSRLVCFVSLLQMASLRRRFLYWLGVGAGIYLALCILIGPFLVKGALKSP